MIKPTVQLICLVESPLNINKWIKCVYIHMHIIIGYLNNVCKTFPLSFFKDALLYFQGNNPHLHHHHDRKGNRQHSSENYLRGMQENSASNTFSRSLGRLVNTKPDLQFLSHFLFQSQVLKKISAKIKIWTRTRKFLISWKVYNCKKTLSYQYNYNNNFIDSYTSKLSHVLKNSFHRPWSVRTRKLNH